MGAAGGLLARKRCMRGLHGAPMAAPADPSGFRPLLRGLPGALGAFVPSVGERLPAAVEHDRLLGTARAHFDSGRAVTPRSQPRAGAGLSRCGGWCGRAQEGTAGRSRNPARPPRRNPETDRDGIYGSERNGLWRKAVLVGLPEPGCTVNPPITSGGIAGRKGSESRRQATARPTPPTTVL